MVRPLLFALFYRGNYFSFTFVIPKLKEKRRIIGLRMISKCLTLSIEFTFYKQSNLPSHTDDWMLRMKIPLNDRGPYTGLLLMQENFC